MHEVGSNSNVASPFCQKWQCEIIWVKEIIFIQHKTSQDGKKVKVRIVAIISLLLFGSALVGLAQQTDCGDAREAAEKIKTAIEKEDVNQIVAFIGEGLWVFDTPYKRAKVLALLRNKKSWLYQAFFGRRDSMKQYILRGNIEIKIQKEGEANLVRLVSKESQALPPSFNIMCIKGKWNLTDIYLY